MSFSSVRTGTLVLVAQEPTISASTETPSAASEENEWEQYMRMSEFWHSLSVPERRCLAKTTEDIPIMSSDLNGLKCAYSDLVEHKHRKLYTHFIVTLAFIALNLYTVTQIAYANWGLSKIRVSLGNLGYVKLNETMMDLCVVADRFNNSGMHINLTSGNMLEVLVHEDMTGRLPDQPMDCLAFPMHRYQSMRILPVIEMIVAWFLALIILVCTLRFLCKSSARPGDGSHSPSAEYMKCTIFVHVLLPQLLSQFSLLKGLGLCSSHGVKALVRGDLTLYFASLIHLLGFDRCWMQGARSKLCLTGVIAMFMIIFGLLAAQLFLVKMMFVLYMLVSSWESWTIWRFIVALGFLNQITGISDEKLAEMNAILVFRFGGEAASWYGEDASDHGEVETVHHGENAIRYFELLAMKLVDGKTMEQSRCPHILVLATLWEMSMASLTAMLLSTARDRNIKHFREERFEHLNKVYGIGAANSHFPDDPALDGALNTFIEAQHDQLSRVITDLRRVSKNKERLRANDASREENEYVNRTSERFRLLAEISDYIFALDPEVGGESVNDRKAEEESPPGLIENIFAQYDAGAGTVDGPTAENGPPGRDGFGMVYTARPQRHKCAARK